MGRFTFFEQLCDLRFIIAMAGIFVYSPFNDECEILHRHLNTVALIIRSEECIASLSNKSVHVVKDVYAWDTATLMVELEISTT